MRKKQHVLIQRRAVHQAAVASQQLWWGEVCSSQPAGPGGAFTDFLLWTAPFSAVDPHMKSSFNKALRFLSSLSFSKCFMHFKRWHSSSSNNYLGQLLQSHSAIRLCSYHTLKSAGLLANQPTACCLAGHAAGQGSVGGAANRRSATTITAWRALMLQPDQSLTSSWLHM